MPLLSFGTPNRERRQASIGVTVWRDRPGAAHPLRTQTNFMDLEPATPPQKAADLAYSLLMDSLERDMDYEEFSFELEGGPEDGVEYKIIVMKL